MKEHQLIDQDKLEYIAGDQLLLDSIRHLWEELNQMHVESSQNFKTYFRGRTFSDRKRTLLEKSERGKIRVELALLKSDQKAIVYCISTLSKNGRGEIDSLFVKKPYRNQGIGAELMHNSLRWMDTGNASSKHVVLTLENKAALRFYKKFGFKQHLIELQK